MQYYKSNITGRILMQNDISFLSEVYGEAGVNDLIESGTIEKIDPPCVVDCLKNGRFNVAAYRYREINRTDAKETVKAVRELQAKMKKMNKSKQ